MRRAIGLLAMAVVLSLGVSAKANVLFDNSSSSSPAFVFGSNVAYTSPHNFINGGVTLTAAAYTTSDYGVAPPSTLTPGTSISLYGKYTIGDATESGLGTQPDTDHEINSMQAVSVFASTSILDMTIGSVQKNEGFAVYSLGGFLLGSFVKTDNTATTVYDVFAASGVTAANLAAGVYIHGLGNDAQGRNVLIDTVTTASVPEPSTLAIAGLGALGMIGYGIRRRKGA